MAYDKLTDETTNPVDKSADYPYGSFKDKDVSAGIDGTNVNKKIMNGIKSFIDLVIDAVKTNRSNKTDNYKENDAFNGYMRLHYAINNSVFNTRYDNVTSSLYITDEYKDKVDTTGYRQTNLFNMNWLTDGIRIKIKLPDDIVDKSTIKFENKTIVRDYGNGTLVNLLDNAKQPYTNTNYKDSTLAYTMIKPGEEVELLFDEINDWFVFLESENSKTKRHNYIKDIAELRTFPYPIDIAKHNLDPLRTHDYFIFDGLTTLSKDDYPILANKVGAIWDNPNDNTEMILPDFDSAFARNDGVFSPTFGQIQEDAGRNATGNIGLDTTYPNAIFHTNSTRGVFQGIHSGPEKYWSGTEVATTGKDYLYNQASFDLSRVWGAAHIANEFRPKNFTVTMVLVADKLI